MKHRVITCLAALLAFANAAWATQLNGFDLESDILDPKFVLQIGTSATKSQVAANPKHIPAAESDWDDSELVMGIIVNDQPHAFPLAVLHTQHLVNDTVKGVPLLVAFCGLCGSGAVYDREVDGRVRVFANSGLLYRADELFYDLETKSLWSPFLNAAVAGSSAGQNLNGIPSEITYWGEWKRDYPKTTVIVRTKDAKDFDEDRLTQLLSHRGYHPKTPTLGISWPDGEAVAFPAAEILEAGGKVTESLEGKDVTVTFDHETQTFHLDTELELKVFNGTWSEWQTAFPEGSWYVARNPDAEPIQL